MQKDQSLKLVGLYLGYTFSITWLCWFTISLGIHIWEYLGTARLYFGYCTPLAVWGQPSVPILFTGSSRKRLLQSLLQAIYSVR